MNKIHIEKIPEEQNKSMARCLLNSMKEFFADSENMKAFEKWEKQREKEAI
ncbi:hypothetical protein M2454_002899 [Aequitasia blattaphilus]|uniref:GNAT family N-acetyltransferase n=1 Tax=Aequitasia blattaphilus TaxID=2949332 RepID=A0ABT1ECN9_9FIRM|nr:hypothetical protein [Aequitasia blattaphilus]MCP1103563.1 hypothetical protein [Aequitasia blattaphilus]MCR8616203.1 hypothetical protein [Aequitasia blattaphilus]